MPAALASVPVLKKVLPVCRFAGAASACCASLAGEICHRLLVDKSVNAGLGFSPFILAGLKRDHNRGYSNPYLRTGSIRGTSQVQAQKTLNPKP